MLEGMVYVVERYLPGLSRSDLLRGLARLERTQELRGEAPGVRYLGSTVVLEDEACFCQFEGPSEAAVAEANQKAGLSFDRIVPAVTVTPFERRSPMTVSPSIPDTIQMRRSRFAGIVVLVAAVAAAITWALATYALNTGDDSLQASAQATAPALTSLSADELQHELALGYGNGLAALGRMQQVQAELPVSYGSGLAAIGTMQRAQDELVLGYANGLAALGKMQQGSFGRADRADTFTPAQLKSIRDYKAFGASKPLTQAELRSIGSYLFGASASLTPAQRQTIRDYKAYGASEPLTPAELRSIGSFLFGTSGR